MNQLSTVLLCLALAPASAGADSARSWDITIKQLEWQDSTPPGAATADVQAWVGSEHNRLWFRAEGGRHTSGAPRDNRLELLWGRELRWWDWMEFLKLEMLLGVRHDTGTTPSRTYGALGFRGELPLGIRFEGTGYLGDGSRNGDDIHSGVRAQVDRSWKFTERLSLAARAEHEMWSEDHVRYSEGHGPAMWSAGLRLHYEVAAGVAPYIGVEWFELVGDTATLAVRAGESDGEARAVVGIQLRFGSR